MIPYKPPAPVTCIRCDGSPATGQDEFCNECRRVTARECELGMFQLRHYLAGWLRFEEWCDAHGQVAI